jgi:hypothetical protein
VKLYVDNKSPRTPVILVGNTEHRTTLTELKVRVSFNFDGTDNLSTCMGLRTFFHFFFHIDILCDVNGVTQDVFLHRQPVRCVWGYGKRSY